MGEAGGAPTSSAIVSARSGDAPVPPTASALPFAITRSVAVMREWLVQGALRWGAAAIQWQKGRGGGWRTFIVRLRHLPLAAGSAGAVHQVRASKQQAGS